MTDDQLHNQARGVRADAERLYVHDPATTLHPTWTQFNAFLREVLELCRLASPQETTNPFLINGTAMESHGSVALPAPGDTVTVADPTWNAREITLTPDITGPFHYDTHAGKWLVFSRFPIPAAHAHRYQSKATAYPVPEENPDGTASA